MGQNSKIEWTDHTFNPWIGCTKVSEGCRHCYAEREMDCHWHKVQWGPEGKRVKTSEVYWRQPLRWNKMAWEECPECGWRGSADPARIHCFCPICDNEELQPTRQRVFCASIADVFEDRPELEIWRQELWALILLTPNLDWLLLTKRPENVMNMIPNPVRDFDKINEAGRYLTGQEIAVVPTQRHGMVPFEWPIQNIWIGVSTENQGMANLRIPLLQRIPARVKFVSCGPLLGPVDLRTAIGMDLKQGAIDLVITEGESGSDARKMHPAWVQHLRDECLEAGIKFYFKQWGAWLPIGGPEHYAFERVRNAGRILDGREWREMP